MRKIYIILMLNLLFACSRKDRTEVETYGKYRMEKVFKDNILASSTTFEGSIMVFYAEYSDDILVKGTEYYPDQKVKAVHQLTKAPNHYTETKYRKNGAIRSQGESDRIIGSDIFLKRGGTIYYTENGKISEIMVFKNDKHKEFLIRHTILDTLKEVIIFDQTYDPPITIDEFNDGSKSKDVP